MNAIMPMLDTASPKVIEVRLSQYPNASWPIETTEFPVYNDLILRHPLNAPSSIVVTEGGISMEFRFIQSMNAHSPMVSMVLGIIVV